MVEKKLGVAGIAAMYEDNMNIASFEKPKKKR